MQVRLGEVSLRQTHVRNPLQLPQTPFCQAQVNAAGTYLWHGHSGSERVDGFYGPLIVDTAGPDPFADLYDEEIVLLLSDWCSPPVNYQLTDT